MSCVSSTDSRREFSSHCDGAIWKIFQCNKILVFDAIVNALRAHVATDRVLVIFLSNFRKVKIEHLLTYYVNFLMAAC